MVALIPPRVVGVRGERVLTVERAISMVMVVDPGATAGKERRAGEAAGS